MQKIVLFTLIVSLLFATAFAGTNNYRFRRNIQEVAVEDPVLISSAPDSTEGDASVVDSSAVDTTIVDTTTIDSSSGLDETNGMLLNTTIPTQPDNTTIVIDNTTTPVFNATIPLQNNTNVQNEQQNLTQYLKVIGRSSGKVKFGQVLIGFTIETLDTQAASALQNNTQIVNTTMEQLKALGLDEGDISVSGIQIQPIYTLAYLNSQVSNETESGELQVEQQQAQQSLQFKVKNSFIVSTNKTDLVGQILDSAMQNGVNSIDYVNYEPLGDDITALREQLLEEALDHAERLAQKVIEKIGYQLGSVMSVSIIDDTSAPVLLGDESAQWNDSQSMYQQLVEVQYAMTAPESQ